MRRLFGPRRQLLSLTGPLILITSLIVWIALLWGGWTLLFAAGENAILDTRNTGTISWWERLYFTGYSIFTLGNGDFSPQGGIWQIATVLTTASGMLFITLSVTYILSVLGAVTQKRALASSISGIGNRSDEILCNSWDGEEFQDLNFLLNTVTSQLNTLNANHKAYPILHYFYSAQAKNAPSVSIVVLDNLLTLLRFGIPEQRRPGTIIVGNARASVQDYLEILNRAFINPANQPPPSPRLDTLREAGIPTVSNEEFADSLNDLDERRRQLRGLIESDLREWPDEDSE